VGLVVTIHEQGHEYSNSDGLGFDYSWLKFVDGFDVKYRYEQKTHWKQL
jgi:hypothetical protein